MCYGVAVTPNGDAMAVVGCCGVGTGQDRLLRASWDECFCRVALESGACPGGGRRRGEERRGEWMDEGEGFGDGDAMRCTALRCHAMPCEHGVRIDTYPRLRRDTCCCLLINRGCLQLARGAVVS